MQGGSRRHLKEGTVGSHLAVVIPGLVGTDEPRRRARARGRTLAPP